MEGMRNSRCEGDDSDPARSSPQLSTVVFTVSLTGFLDHLTIHSDISFILVPYITYTYKNAKAFQ